MEEISDHDGKPTMSDDQAILGVYLSETLDLHALYGDALSKAAGEVVLVRPEDVTDPAEVRFAICWQAGPDAFAPYANLGLAMSIGAGVDDLMAHPGLGPDIAIARVRDPHQAALMAGYAAHEVLHVSRGFGQMAASAAEHRWEPIPMRAPEETTIAVLGNGTMGQAVTRALGALGFTLRVACRTAPSEPLPSVSYHIGETGPKEAAEGADFLINILPLTPATDGILNAALFSKMARGSWLIQIGRGENLDEADLVSALNEGQLAGATLDVFRQEPLPQDHPFWQDARLRITPHIASDSVPAVVAQQVVETARQLRDGMPLSMGVDRKRGY